VTQITTSDIKTITSWPGKVKSQRPRVLEKLPLSARLLFGAFVALADNQSELQISTRALGEYTGLSEPQVRRGIRRLIAVRLLEVVALGSGPIPTTYHLRWRTRSFPQPSASPSKNTPESDPKSNPSVLTKAPVNDSPSSLRGVTPPEDPPKPTSSVYNLHLPVSEKGRCWALGEIRRFLIDCKVPGAKRAELMLAFARGLKLALRAGRIRNGRELGELVRLCKAAMQMRDQYRPSRLANLSPPDRYAAVMRLLAEKLTQVENEREDELASERELEKIRREKAEARQAWKQASQIDFSNTNAIKLASRESVDAFIAKVSRVKAGAMSDQLARRCLLKIRLLTGFARLNKDQRRTLKRLCQEFHERVFGPSIEGWHGH